VENSNQVFDLDYLYIDIDLYGNGVEPVAGSLDIFISNTLENSLFCCRSCLENEIKTTVFLFIFLKNACYSL